MILVVVVAAWVLGVGLRRRARRDLCFVGLPPGLVPATGAVVPTAPVAADPVVAVRFTPPEALSVAEVGALWSKSLRSRDLAATIIDLAVRGHLRIEALPLSRDGHADWKLVATTPAAGTAVRDDSVRDYEVSLLGHIFSGRSTVRLSSLRATRITGRREMLALVDAGLLAQGLLAHSLTRRPRLAQRTALGRAYHEQARSFERYLATVQPHQLPDDATTAFSRYLPYAIVFDLSDRWVGLFSALLARPAGSPTVDTAWFVGADGGSLSGGLAAISGSLDAFTDTVTDWFAHDSFGDGGSGDGGGDSGGDGGGDGGGGGD